MAKKIVEVKDTKKAKSKIDISKIKEFAEENPELVELAKDKIIDLLDGDDDKSSKKSSSKKSSSKKSKKSDPDLSTLIKVAGTLLNDKK